MRRSVLVLCAVLFIEGCSPAIQPVSKSTLYVFRLTPPALVELDASMRPAREVPVAIPEGCGLQDLYGPPHGALLALELNCTSGEAVLTVDSASGALHQPITDSDSHFLAWTDDGRGLYLKVNLISRPQIVRVDASGSRTEIPISELTYDLAAKPDSSGDFSFALSGGMGYGSELWLAQGAGRSTRQLAANPVGYLSLARWSPDGTWIAFIQIPDSPTPYTIGQLWVMQPDGNEARRLADVDAGHGFAPTWSPDGNQIAFVHRDNPNDATADQSAGGLVSDLYAVSLVDGKERALTTFNGARVEAPSWQPDGNYVAFTVVLDDRMSAYVLDATSGALQPIPIESACCVAWVRK